MPNSDEEIKTDTETDNRNGESVRDGVEGRRQVFELGDAVNMLLCRSQYIETVILVKPSTT